MKEINEKKLSGKIRNVKIGKFLEAGKLYNLDTELEDKNGTLRPAVNHIWVTWEKSYVNDEGTERFSKEAENFSTEEEAKKFAEFLKSRII